MPVTLGEPNIAGTSYLKRTFGGFAAGTSAPDYPTDTNVRNGTTYGNGAYTGSMTEPAVTDVKSGVQYGAHGTEFTGTLSGGGGGVSGSFG